MTITLITHICVALAGIGFSTAAAIHPSRRLLRASYGLVVGTIATGTYLVVALHTGLLHACLTGLLYLGVTLGAAAIAEYRLRHSQSPAA